MAEKSPAFQFYPKDFLSDGKVMAMSMAQRGMYITLLSIDWIDDGICESQFERLCSALRVELGGSHSYDKAIAELKQCFNKHPTKDGYISNPRLQKERQGQIERRADKQKAGEKGAQSRWGKHNYSSANGKAITNDSSSSSSSSSSSNIKYKIDLPCIKLEQNQWDAWVLNFHHGNETAAREMCVAASDYRQGEGKGVPSECMAYLRQWFKRSLRFDQPKTIISKHDKPIEAPRPQPQLFEPPPKPKVSEEAAKKFKDDLKKLIRKTSDEVAA